LFPGEYSEYTCSVDTDDIHIVVYVTHKHKRKITYKSPMMGKRGVFHHIDPKALQQTTTILMLDLYGPHMVTHIMHDGTDPRTFRKWQHDDAKTFDLDQGLYNVSDSLGEEI
jgi:hypothetical protein